MTATKFYLSLSSLFGLGITITNLMNAPFDKVKKLPSNHNRQRLMFKYVFVSGIKGWIYGALFPFSPIKMLFDSLIESDFRKHIVPCSVYFRDVNIDD